MNTPMKRILYMLPAFLLMASCGGQKNNSLSDTSHVSDQLIEPMIMSSVSSYDGVTMSVENLNEFKIPVDSIVVSISNNTDNELLFGEMYNLEKRSGDNWIPMPYNREYEEGEAELVFSAVGYRYAPHSTNSNVNYTLPYSLRFDSGIYRLTKNFRVGTAAGWNRKDSISVVFEIR